MSVESVISNEDNRLIFLKAILFGINYGKSNTPDSYTKTIEEEILKIKDKKSNVSITNKNSKNSVNNSSQNSRYESIISNLETQRNGIVSMIKNLSSNNYGANFSKINLLQSNLALINKEIEKNKLSLSKYKEKNSSVYVKPNDSSSEDLTIELRQTLSGLSNLFAK